MVVEADSESGGVDKSRSGQDGQRCNLGLEGERTTSFKLSQAT